MKSVHFSVETTTLLPPQVILSFCPSPLQPLLQERLFLPRLRQRPLLWLPSLLGMLQIFISSALRALYTWHLGVSSRVTFTAGPCLTTSYLPAKRHHRLFSFYLFRLFPTAYYSLEVSPGKNTGVGCHFLLQCMKVKSKSDTSDGGAWLASSWWSGKALP